MDVLEPKDRNEIVACKDAGFETFIDSGGEGIKLVAEEYQHCKEKTIKADGGGFSKWLAMNHGDIHCETEVSCGKLVLRSSDIWIPLAYLASDVILRVYLNLISQYIFVKMKSCLKNERARVHLSALYLDKGKGMTKKFIFDGDVDTLTEIIKKFDINDFLND